eukprot:TRINITY_DN1651_c2_g1_i1.p1 TRINITY_DN1651_c2_g1~~TRINITY_DN1651_c2_g1_i1.p1  ORF type:complete len:219 (-),score=62.37 TRINITY_DN1651_c2_g1_i1:78-734(-)
MSYTFRAYPNNPNASKTFIAAQFGSKLDIQYPQDFKFTVDNTTPEFLKKAPTGQVPILETPEGTIFESNAIAKYVARKTDPALLGGSVFEQSLVDSWIEFSRSSERNYLGLILPILGWGKFDQKSHDDSLAGTNKAFAAVERWLADGSRKYLVGDRVTLADIIIWTQVYAVYKFALGKSHRAPYPHVLEWLNRLAETPEFKAVVPELGLTEEDGKPKA